MSIRRIEIDGSVVTMEYRDVTAREFLTFNREVASGDDTEGSIALLELLDGLCSNVELDGELVGGFLDLPLKLAFAMTEELLDFRLVREQESKASSQLVNVSTVDSTAHSTPTTRLRSGV